MNDLDPLAEQTKSDIHQLTVQMANVNQGITKLETRMQGIEEKQDKTVTPEQRYQIHHNQLESSYITNHNKMICKVKTIHADFQKLEEKHDKTVADKKDLANLIKATQASQRKMGGAIRTLSERISFLKEEEDFIENIFDR